MLNGITKGLETGLSSIVRALRMLQQAIKDNDQTKIAALENVFNTWVTEISDEKGNLKAGIGKQLIAYAITGFHDPFANSRHLLQQIK